MVLIPAFVTEMDDYEVPARQLDDWTYPETREDEEKIIVSYISIYCCIYIVKCCIYNYCKIL
jgi:hypothetical protein